jgi:murein L,D-transpeptidase YafK
VFIKPIAMFALLFPILPPYAWTPETGVEKPIGKADRVRVDKSERRLELLRDSKVVAAFSVALGRSPVGDKEKQGDMRTPEGRYTIDWRNPGSKYHRSLHISYPDNADKARAAKLGDDPGGDIMIHGQPNGYAQPASILLQRSDWTFGCIAVSNAAMDAIWKAVPDGAPIEITP